MYYKIMDKELEKITKAISKWVKANDNEVAFISDFIMFDEEDGVKDDSIYCAYGCKETLIMMLEDTLKEIKKEKGDFINW